MTTANELLNSSENKNLSDLALGYIIDWEMSQVEFANLLNILLLDRSCNLQDIIQQTKKYWSLGSDYWKAITKIKQEIGLKNVKKSKVEIDS